MHPTAACRVRVLHINECSLCMRMGLLCRVTVGRTRVALVRQRHRTAQGCSPSCAAGPWQRHRCWQTRCRLLQACLKEPNLPSLP